MSQDNKSLIEELEKARQKMSDEYDPNDIEDTDSELGEGFREFDPDEEQSSGDDWLKENDPAYAKQGEEYDEYGDDEDEDDHQRSIAEDYGVDEAPEASATSPSQKEEKQEASQEVGKPKSSRFRQPTREELMSFRSYTRPWEQRAREAAKLKADPSKNPVLAQQGNLIEARNQAHGDRKSAYQKFTSSDEYKNADPITQMEMDDKFEADWKAKNPTHLYNALQVHHDAHEKGKFAKDMHAAAKDAQIQNILTGGTHSPDSFSTEEGLQHVGGVKGEEGTVGSIKSDPASSFAMGNQDFIKQYAKDYASKGKKVGHINDMMEYNQGSQRDINRILGEGPAKDPKFEEFFSHYYPLIGMNASRTIKTLGLDPKNPDIDMSMLHEAGMHGLIQAMNDYDHSNPSKASFATHAANKIRGLQMTAMKNQDAIPTEVRQAQKKFASESKGKKLFSEPKHPEMPNINDRMSRVNSQRQVQAVRRPAGTPKPPQPKIEMPKIGDTEDVDN